VDSHELIGRSGGNRWIPLAAVIQDDFRQIIRHWAFLLWAGLALVLPILWISNVSGLTAGSLANVVRQWGTHEVAKPKEPPTIDYDNQDGSGRHLANKPQSPHLPWGENAEGQALAQKIARDGAQNPEYREEFEAAVPTVPGSASHLGGKLLGMHLLVWIGFAMALGATAISVEFASIGESVMCWGVARWQYFVGKLAARTTAAFLLVMLLTLPMLYLFNAKTRGDVAFWPSIQTTFTCACLVACVVAAGVAVGTWFRTSMRAVGFSLMALVLFGGACAFIAPIAYSPTAFVETIPGLLRGAEPSTPSSALTMMAYTAGGLSVVSLGKFMLADL
jgi:hypothetical protein